MQKKVIVIGAGPAGIGVGVLLKKMKIPFTILEKDDIGSSFRKWPEEMRFISPSFTGNFFSLPDLNAITPTSSPAYTLQTEHPTGREYADYLEAIAKYHKLPIKKQCEVRSLKKNGDIFHLKTSKGTLQSPFVIWAAGEYQYPNATPFNGAEHCIHNSLVPSWRSLNGDKFVVIGAYESGMDAAHQLAALGKKVTVLDAGDQISNTESDSSYSLSPFTRDRFEEQKSHIDVLVNSLVTSVSKKKGQYVIETKSGKKIQSKTKPILATGFITSLSLVDSLFETANGHVALTDNDESTKTPGLFLVGPQVQHKNAIFCFIYKYRQRFPIVAETIAQRLGKSAKAEEVVAKYKQLNFYLRDLSCCDDKCTC